MSNIDERIKNYMEARKDDIEGESRKCAKELLSQIWDFQDEMLRKRSPKEICGFMVGQIKDGDLFSVKFLMEDKEVVVPVLGTSVEFKKSTLKSMKDILEEHGITCSNPDEPGFEALY